MTIWIDSNNVLHDDMDGQALSLPSWPQGMTQATQEQITAITTPPTLTAQQQALAQIVAIEQANPFTHRHFRDAFDTITQVIVAVNPTYDMSKIPGFAAVASVEAQIAALRSNLK